MKIARETVTTKALASRVNRDKINLKHKLQRKEDAWSPANKSLLIDSLIRGYVVPPIYTISEDGKQHAIDGIQRLGAIKKFYNDEYKLSKKLQTVEIDGTEYIIGGKTYSKLDDVVKEALDIAQLQIYDITDYTEKDVREMFKRLNSGKGLNTTQKMTPLYSEEMGDIIFNLASNPLFEKILTEKQIISSNDQEAVLEVLMYSELSDDYDFGSFSKNAKSNFIERYNDLLAHDDTKKAIEEKLSVIKKSLDRLNSELTEEDSIKPGTISIVIYGLYYTYKIQKSTSKYIEWLKGFIADYGNNEEYKQYLMNGTSSANNVKGRYEYIRKVVNNL